MNATVPTIKKVSGTSHNKWQVPDTFFSIQTLYLAQKRVNGRGLNGTRSEYDVSNPENFHIL